MKTVIVVQARRQSTRLADKVLLDLAGRPMLARQLARLRQCRRADEVVVATTRQEADQAVVELAETEGVRWYRGDTADVLRRFLGAARECQADVVVRTTADCPLIDPQIADRVIGELVEHSGECDYASNVVRRTYPRGLDTEAFFFDTLVRMERLSKSPASREHVTLLPRSERRDLFLTRDVVDSADNSDLRWTVDTADDLRLVRLLFEELGLAERVLPYEELLGYVRARPHLAQLNAQCHTWSPP